MESPLVGSDNLKKEPISAREGCSEEVIGKSSEFKLTGKDGSNGRMSIEASIKSLQMLASKRATEATGAMLAQVSNLRFENNADLEDRERIIVDEILLELVQQVESTLKKDLAEKIAHHSDIPAELLDFLINDEISVAEPLLEACRMITEDQLVGVVETQTDDHRVVVAGRPDVTERIAGSLVEHGGEAVLVALVKNTKAKISVDSYRQLGMSAKDVETLRRPLLSRKDLPKLVANRMFWWVSSALRHHIMVNFSMEQTTLAQLMADAGEVAPDDSLTSAVERKVQRILDSASSGFIDRLITEIQVESVGAMEKSFAQRFRISPETAKCVVEDQSGEGLALACKAAGADSGQFVKLSLLMDYKKYGQARPTGQIERLSKVFDSVSAHQAAKTIAMWDEGVIEAA